MATSTMVVDRRDHGTFTLDRRLVDEAWIVKLGVLTFAFYVALVRYADQDSMPSLETVASKVGITPSQIPEHTKRLEAVGLMDFHEIDEGDMMDVVVLPLGNPPEEADSEALFEEAWGIYPKRPGNPKAAARRAWMARIKEGVDPQEMLTGTRKYAAYVKEQRTDPRYVKMARTFYGPDHHFAADYEVDSDPQRSQKEEELLDFYAKEELV